MVEVRDCRRSDGASVARLVAQDTDPVAAFAGIGPEDIALGVGKAFGFPVWGLLTVSRWLRVPLARLLVAVDGDDVIGFVTVGFQGGSATIGSLFVEPSRRRTGLGSALMEAAETAARARKVRWAVLEVFAGNDTARRLYRGRGYRVVYGNHWLEGSLSNLSASARDGAPVARAATRRDERRLHDRDLQARPSQLPGRRHRPGTEPGSIEPYARSKRGERRAWIVGPVGAPSGFVRAFTSAEGGLSFLSCPVLLDSCAEVEQSALFGTAFDWLRNRGATRTVTAVTDRSASVLASLKRAGLTERLRSEIMLLELDGRRPSSGPAKADSGRNGATE